MDIVRELLMAWLDAALSRSGTAHAAGGVTQKR
jgi:hypothetical protein